MNVKISRHALRRYKKRIGGRTASYRRTKQRIETEIRTNTIRKYKQGSDIVIECKNFTAVSHKGAIITILEPGSPVYNFEENAYRFWGGVV